uniref:Uncharacterized protein n=1 Tax=Octactis speculum TaxID=3111310 RepID=A0A7S2MEP5_9STRA|mmetsp:Transcript_60882/g.83604  ORF Transcript_60882/g.83604 Transcript_60882/m.83604 type:complete len:276 (+) Transcript_60882:90-917(+)|eukprot:CAMPEP_0185772128 /NCGR_PEP_ID=MMETSP1174-20130828/67124_1 /TAXON_ID=35687 /ORGANISM="Dictyocha speculum, Strain CCMP1381" /LENGTH=275 /DNA_ID=CAMNT_0028458233 /DNA_START=50 /DNA_END=877 /DNA_ORIENTATION=+
MTEYKRKENIFLILLALFPISSLSFIHNLPQVLGHASLSESRRGLLPPIYADRDQNVPKSSPDLVVPDTFVLSGMAEDPVAEELSNANMLAIILGVATDEEVNSLVWKCLGYRQPSQQTATGEGVVSWTNSKCFPKWRERFPEPPDLVGVTRIYSKEVDGPVLKANQALVRTIPMAHKQSIRTHLRPIGFNGFKLDELTPNKTRRAQCANWMIYYREELWGVSIEELVKRKEQDVERENLAIREAGESIKVAKAGVLPRDSYRMGDQKDGASDKP